MNEPVRVLFVCVGNSCRSPMAEGFARHKHGDIVEPASAGVWPASIVQPETISTMAEKGVSLEGQQPRSIKSVEDAKIDLVVNMSGMAVLHFFPDFKGHNLVWKVRDPIGQPAEVYRKVRDRIERLVDEMAESLRKQGQAPRPAPPE